MFGQEQLVESSDENTVTVHNCYTRVVICVCRK